MPAIFLGEHQGIEKRQDTKDKGIFYGGGGAAPPPPQHSLKKKLEVQMKVRVPAIFSGHQEIPTCIYERG